MSIARPEVPVRPLPVPWPWQEVVKFFLLDHARAAEMRFLSGSSDSDRCRCDGCQYGERALGLCK
jgi:hypothetical protein